LREKVGMRGIYKVVFILLSPTLSNRRGSQVDLQLFVFIMQKSCVDTYAIDCGGLFASARPELTFMPVVVGIVLNIR